MLNGQDRRHVLVVGASSAIGRAVCSEFLSRGYRVTGHYAHSRDELNPLLQSSSEFNIAHADLTDLESAAVLGDEYRFVDSVIFLSSLAVPSSLTSVDSSVLLESLNVGALSNFVIMGRVGPSMIDRKWGRFVIGSSIGVKFGGGRDSFAYALANHLSEFIPREAAEWCARGVLTNVIRIGITDTDLHTAFPSRNLDQRVSAVPMMRMATADEIAPFLFWYGSHFNTFVTGQVVAISGGE